MEERLFDEAFLHKLERLAILSRRAIAGQVQGERRSTKRGQSVEFSDFRPYVMGDDFRRIDWNAYARLEKFFIKLFVEEEDLTVHLLIDTSRSMDWGTPNKLAYASRVGAALGYISLISLDRVTVTALGHLKSGVSNYLPPIRGKQQAMTLFRFLQAISGEGTFPAQHLNNYASNSLQVGPAIIVSDLMDEDWTIGINHLASRGFETTVIHLLSQDEVDPEKFGNPPMAGDYRLTDHEIETQVEITADYEILERYRQQLFEWRQSFQKFCGARGIHYVPIDTSISIEDLLFSWLRKQGVLQ